MSLLFKLYYKPTVIGSKNIPEFGPTILCGNHLNELDSKLIKSVVKRPVYSFNNNYEDMIDYLNNDYAVLVFPESTINIYRLVQLKIMSLEHKIVEINNNNNLRNNDRLTYICNLKIEIEKELEKLESTKKKLLDSGIKVIDYDILLPFDKKIVKIARETNSKIVPFAINGKFIYGNNDLKIRFGNSLTVTDDLEESNNIVRENVKKLEYKNLKK